MSPPIMSMSDGNLWKITPTLEKTETNYYENYTSIDEINQLKLVSRNNIEITYARYMCF